jgi:hypothetical protein
MMTQTEHNDAQWLVVRQQEGHGRAHINGWYVVRICPCHWGLAVTLPYPSEERAQRARRVILGLEGRSPERPEWIQTPPVPAAVVPGQVWRRNRTRGSRYFQVIDNPHHGLVNVVSVERDQNGGWRRLMFPQHGMVRSQILERRLMLGEHRTARAPHPPHSYTWVDDAELAAPEPSWESALLRMEAEVVGE